MSKVVVKIVSFGVIICIKRIKNIVISIMMNKFVFIFLFLLFIICKYSKLINIVDNVKFKLNCFGFGS